MAYWYCLTHERVEQEGDTCPTSAQLGPYDTRAEAAWALDKVNERNDEWDDDPTWNDAQEDDWER